MIGLGVVAVGIVGVTMGLTTAPRSKNLGTPAQQAARQARYQRQMSITHEGDVAWHDKHNFKLAEEKYKEALAVKSSVTVEFRLAELYEETGQQDLALKAYRELFYPSSGEVAGLQNDPYPNYRYAALCRTHGLLDEEQKAYERVARNIGLSPARTAHGEVDSQTMAQVHLQIGDALQAQKHDQSGAQEQYLMAYDLKPKSNEVLVTLADRLLAVGDKGKAVQIYKNVYSSTSDVATKQHIESALYTAGVKFASSQPDHIVGTPIAPHSK